MTVPETKDIGVAVGVKVGVGVKVAVGVNVAVGVKVGVKVPVGVKVAVRVKVAVGVCVGVGVNGTAFGTTINTAKLGSVEVGVYELPTGVATDVETPLRGRFIKGDVEL